MLIKGPFGYAHIVNNPDEVFWLRRNKSNEEKRKKIE